MSTGERGPEAEPTDHGGRSTRLPRDDTGRRNLRHECPEIAPPRTAAPAATTADDAKAPARQIGGPGLCFVRIDSGRLPGPRPSLLLPLDDHLRAVFARLDRD